MGNDREEWIAARAYKIWEQTGKPSGYDSQHWAQARREWESGPAAQSEGSTPGSWTDEEE